MATYPIRVLLVEDSPEDRLLIEHHLETDPLTIFEIISAQRLADGLQKLATQKFEVVLLDLGLPDSQGLATFQNLYNQYPQVPIVVLSGLVDEDLAVVAVRAGAQDYIVKDAANLSTLGRSLRYAAERHQVQLKLRQSEARLKSFLDAAPDAMLIVNKEGQIILANRQTEKLFGYSQAELLGLHVDRLVPERLHGQHQFHRAEFLANPKTQTAGVSREIYALTKDGREFPAEISLSHQQVGDEVVVLSAVRDITERKQIEEALCLSEERHRQISGMTSDYVYSGIVYPDGTTITEWLSGAYERITGYTSEEIKNLPGGFSSLVAPADLAQIISQQPILFEQQALRVEYRLRRKDGQIRWLQDHMQLVSTNEPEKGIRLIGGVQDITEQKQAEQELQELNRTLEERVKQRTAEVQDLYDNAPIGYHSLDTNGNIIMANQTQLDWLGYTRAELIGRPISDFLTPASIAAFQEGFQTFIQYGRVTNVEFEMIRKDGSIIPVLLNATAVYDRQGNYVMSRSTIFDNTERKKAELALRESEAQNRLLFEESPDAVTLFDEAGRVVQVNHAAEKLTGYVWEQLIGRRWDELGLVSGEQEERLAAAVMQAMQLSGSFAATDFKLKQANGEFCDVGARVFGLNIQGRQHYLATMRDITAEKQVEETLRRANAELERAARAKDEFLATMSHELRTPLNAILGLSEALLDEIRGPLNERQQNSLRHIEASGQHLLALINDILDLSKVEAGRIELQFETVPVAEVCQASLQFVREIALKKQQQLSFTTNNQLVKIEADPKRLKQMLVNLLSNAVKFTPAGGQISLEVTTDAPAGLIRLAVQDNGIGISPADIDRLFQPFMQLDSSLSRQYEGTGLGLALVRRLAQLHGGSVTVESEPGQGSCFTIILPYRLPQAVETKAPAAAAPEEARSAGVPDPRLAPESAERAAGGRILLAEDQETNIQTITNYLQAKGFQMVVARNGREALAQAEASRPDLILMDIQMPEMDGLEAIRCLRARPEFALTPIIALTALAMRGDEERCLQAGANQYLSKPISLKVLVAAIKELLQL